MRNVGKATELPLGMKMNSEDLAVTCWGGSNVSEASGRPGLPARGHLRSALPPWLPGLASPMPLVEGPWRVHLSASSHPALVDTMFLCP